MRPSTGVSTDTGVATGGTEAVLSELKQPVNKTSKAKRTGIHARVLEFERFMSLISMLINRYI